MAVKDFQINIGVTGNSGAALNELNRSAAALVASVNSARASFAGLGAATRSVSSPNLSVPSRLPRELDGLRLSFLGLGQASNIFGLGMSTNLSSAISLFNALGPAGAAAGTAITAGFAAIKESIAVFASFEKAIKDVEIVSGASTATLASFETEVRRVAIESKFTATEVAGAASELIKAGLSADAAKKALQGVADFSAAGDILPGKAAGMMVEVASAYQLSADKFKSIGDQIITSANVTTASVDSLAAGLKYIVPLSAAAGYEFSSIAADLGTMHNAGLRGTKAATSLRQVFSLLEAPTKKVSELLAEMNSRLEASGNALFQVTDDFGNFTGFADFSRALQQSGVSVSELMGAFKKEGGAAAAALKNVGAETLLANELIVALSQSAAVTMKNMRVDTISGGWAIFKSNLEEVGVAFGKTVRDDIVNSLKQASDAVINNREGFVWFMDILYEAGAILAKVAASVLSLTGDVLQFFGTAPAGQFLLKTLQLISEGWSEIFKTFGSLKTDFEEMTKITGKWEGEFGILTNTFKFLLSISKDFYDHLTKIASAFGKLIGYKSTAAMPGGEQDIAKAVEYEKKLIELQKRLDELNKVKFTQDLGADQYSRLQTEISKTEQRISSLKKEQAAFVTETRNAADAQTALDASRRLAEKTPTAQKSADYLNNFSTLLSALQKEEEQAKKIGVTYVRNNEVIDRLKTTLKALGLEGQFDAATMSAKDLRTQLKLVDEAYQKFLSSSHAVYNQAQKDALQNAFSGAGSVNTDQAAKALRDYAETQRQTALAAAQAYIQRQAMFGQQITIEGQVTAATKAMLATDKDIAPTVDKNSDAWKRQQDQIQKTALSIAQHEMATNKLVASQQSVKAAIDGVGGGTKKAYELMQDLSRGSRDAANAQALFKSELKLSEEALSAQKGPLESIIRSAKDMQQAFSDAVKASNSAILSADAAISKTYDGLIKNATTQQQLQKFSQEAIQWEKTASADRLKVVEETKNAAIEAANQKEQAVLASGKAGLIEMVAATYTAELEKKKASFEAMQAIIENEQKITDNLIKQGTSRAQSENQARQLTNDAIRAGSAERDADLVNTQNKIEEFQKKVKELSKSGDTTGAAAAQATIDGLKEVVNAQQVSSAQTKVYLADKKLQQDNHLLNEKENNVRLELETQRHAKANRDLLLADKKSLDEIANSSAFKGVVNAGADAKTTLSFLEGATNKFKEAKAQADATAASLTETVASIHNANIETQTSVYKALGDTSMLQYLEAAKDIMLRIREDLKTGNYSDLSAQVAQLQQLQLKIKERVNKIVDISAINDDIKDQTANGEGVEVPVKAGKAKNAPAVKTETQKEIDKAGPAVQKVEVETPKASEINQKTAAVNKDLNPVKIPTAIEIPNVDVNPALKSAKDLQEGFKSKLQEMNNDTKVQVDAINEKIADLEARKAALMEFRKTASTGLTITDQNGNTTKTGGQAEADKQIARLEQLIALEQELKTTLENAPLIAAAEAARKQQDLEIVQQELEAEKAQKINARLKAAEEEHIKELKEAQVRASIDEVAAMYKAVAAAKALRDAPIDDSKLNPAIDASKYAAASQASAALNAQQMNEADALYKKIYSGIEDNGTRGSFVNSFKSMFSSGVTEALAENDEALSILGTQASFSLVTGISSNPVKEALNSLKASVSELAPAPSALSMFLDSIQDACSSRKFTVDVVGKVSIQENGGAFFTGGIVGDNLPRFATGGLVSGPGGIDNIVARVTAGEGIIRQSSMQKLGRDTFNFINKTGTLPKTPDAMQRTTIELAGRSGLALEGNPVQVKKIVEVILKELRK